MELIYFISGILTVGTVYGVLLLRKVKSSHTELLESSSRLLDLTQATRENVLGKFNDANKRMIRINEENEKLLIQMKDDAYVGNTELNERITELVKTFNQQRPNTPNTCLLYTSPSPRDRQKTRMPSSA